MAILNNNPLVGASGNQGGYNINNSLRFRRSATAYLSRTPSSTTNRQIGTLSLWFKRGQLGVRTTIACWEDTSTGNGHTIEIGSDDKLTFYNSGTSSTADIITTQVFRDPSAWYHFVIAFDTTQATASNRVKMYINGNQITAFGTATYPSQNVNLSFNTTNPSSIGRRFVANTDMYFDGYMADINWIDGQALTPSSFGETDTTTGVWKPKAYSGTYGTNGFYLKFSDIATTSGSNAGLGKDFSGNSNYWTTNNISVTSGTTYDAMTDSPTNTSSTVANYAVLDPLDPTTSGNMTLSNANLTMTTSAANRSRLSTIYVPSGKWYAEVTFTTSSGSLSGCMVGLCRSEDATSVVASYLGSSTNSYGYNQGGDKYNAGSASAYGASYTTGDIIGIAFDADAGTVTFYKNNTSQGTAFTGLSTSSLWSIGVSSGISSASANIVSNINFGQRPFSYTPPTGYVALNTYNLPTPTILQGNTNFNILTWTGTGTSSGRSFTGVGFAPDLVWAKPRSVAYDHNLNDKVRGANKRLRSNTTDAENTNDTYGYLSSFDSDGWTTVSGATENSNWNQTSATYVAWCWKANGAGSSNTSGSITSTVSVNTTAGFSVVTYTGTGANATVGHGLGVAPKMMIIKCRSAAGDNWRVYHASLGATKFLDLNQTSAAGTATSVWNDTAPTSTVWTVGTNGEVNRNTSTYVGYIWAEIAGFSKFGSYTGNGSADGPFLYLGFRPKFIMIKKTSAAGDSWYIKDTSRSSYNVGLETLLADTSGAEAAGESWDALSNGIKLRTTGSGVNTSGATYIYMAFAENPTKFAIAR